MPNYHRQRTNVKTDDNSSTFGETGVYSSVISHHEVKRREKGQPVII